MKPKTFTIIFIIISILFISFLPRLRYGRENSFENNRDRNDKFRSVLDNTLKNYPCIPSPENYEVGVVSQVIDGDSIRVIIDGQEFEVRYIGIDAPEMTGEDQTAGRESKAANQLLVEGKEVVLFRDVSQTDQFGRLLRYVLVESVFVNYQMVLDGHAIAKSYPPDIACQNYFNEAKYSDLEEFSDNEYFK